MKLAVSTGSHRPVPCDRAGLVRGRGRRLEPAMPQRCNQDMVRRLLALVPVLMVVGCVGGSHEGHGGMSRPHSPPSAPSPAVASGAARPGQLHGVPLTGTTG